MKRAKNKNSKFDILTEESVLSNVPEKAGIYFIWARLPKGNWDCIHVAESDNLKSNLMQHLSETGVKDAIKSKVQRFICGYEWSLT